MSHWRVLREDLRELPLFISLGWALRRALARGPETFGPRIRLAAERHPERILLRFERETVTYGEYNRAVNAYAAVLAREGVRRGEPVAIIMENSPELLFAQGACAKLGAIGALINHHLTGDALRHVLGVSGARVALVDAASFPAFAAIPPRSGLTVLVNLPPEDLPANKRSLPEALGAVRAEEPAIPELSGNDPFLYMYTSGTTGYPKPALVRHARFTLGGLALPRLFGVGPEDVIYAPLPLYHGESNFVGFSVAFHARGTFTSRRRFSASAFLDDVRRHRATMFVYVGELCRYLLRQPPSDRDRDHGLRVAAGAGLAPDIWAAFQERFGIPRIVEMYGATEGNISLMNRGGRVGSVGRPYPFQHGQVRLARYDIERGDLVRGPDGFLVPCADGEPGELLGRVGRGIMPYDGYVDRKASEAKLVRDAFARGDAWFRTGDLLRRDRDGYFYFVDRVGDTFRWKGENVSTQEVAAVLSRAAGVNEANVYGVRVPGEDGRAGMAALVLAPGASPDLDALYAHLERNLPSYARPLFLRVVTEMDVTGTLKQRKVVLQAEGYDPAAVSDPLYLRDDRARTFVPLTVERFAELQRQGTRVPRRSGTAR